MDRTSNSGKDYICEDGTNGIYDNRIIFDTKKDAEKFAEKWNNFSIWGVILEE